MCGKLVGNMPSIFAAEGLIFGDRNGMSEFKKKSQKNTEKLERHAK